MPPCPAGQERSRLSSTLALESGLPSTIPPCETCTAGKYKPSDGLWSTTCSTYLPCGIGEFLTRYSLVAPGVCEPCEPSTYKDLVGSWSSQCNLCPVGANSSAGSIIISQCICKKGWKQSTLSSSVMYNFGVGPRFAYVSASARAPK